MSSLITKVQPSNSDGCTLHKRINDEKEVIYFRTKSPAYKSILTYIELLCERIQGTGNKVLNKKYTLQNKIFRDCSIFLEKLEKLCDETDLNANKGSATLRFGHIAFRDWFDSMKTLCREFVNQELAIHFDEHYRDELFTYLSESFGNRMRIDYGTGHELNFIIFTMGLLNLVKTSPDDSDLGTPSKSTQAVAVTPERLKLFVMQNGVEVLSLFAHKYLRLCRKIQTKFRLEPAGSRGVYNMDDFQFLPFLFGAAQLVGIKYITTGDFYLSDQVDMFKSDFIFFDAVDFILNNKRGPFNEHSYTLWCFTSLGSWDNIYRRIRMKFTEDILGPFPIVQHFLFGRYILRWDVQHDEQKTAS